VIPIYINKLVALTLLSPQQADGVLRKVKNGSHLKALTGVASNAVFSFAIKQLDLSFIVLQL
jgi:hypothetical protein